MATTIDENGFFHFEQTQGQKKVIKRIRDLFTNKFFLEEIDNIFKIKNSRKMYSKAWKFAKKYKLKFNMLSPLFEYIASKQYKKAFNKKCIDELERDIENDVCIIRDDVDTYLNELFPYEFNTPPGKRALSRLEINNYPIRISISPMASKRDVLDFINKRWKYIGSLLEDYDDGNKLVRKYKKKDRDEFIWKHRMKPAKEIASMVNEKFPNENLIYSDISSIIYYLSYRSFQHLQ